MPSWLLWSLIWFSGGFVSLLVAIGVVENDRNAFTHPKPYLLCGATWMATVALYLVLPHVDYLKSWFCMAAHAGIAARCFGVSFWRGALWMAAEMGVMAAIYLALGVTWIVFAPWMGGN